VKVRYVKMRELIVSNLRPLTTVRCETIDILYTLSTILIAYLLTRTSPLLLKNTREMLSWSESFEYLPLLVPLALYPGEKVRNIRVKV